MDHDQILRLAVQRLMRLAKQAYDDPVVFFELIARHEITRDPLEIAPHQEFMFRFLQAAPYCVIRMPVGCGKTFTFAVFALWLMGRDHTERGVIVSATQDQSSKPLKMVSDYITSPELTAPVRLVFPDLRRATREGEPWTQTKIAIERPPAIRDPSLVAAGIDKKIEGSRLSWVLADDVISIEQTLSKDARDKTAREIHHNILSRMDPGSSAHFAVTQTPCHVDDVTFRLEKQSKWATVTMSIYGDIEIANVDPQDADFREVFELVRPSNDGKTWRLRAHDKPVFDYQEKVPLWPERFDLNEIEKVRKTTPASIFARTRLCRPVDDETTRCKAEWIDQCKDKGDGLELIHRLDPEELPTDAFVVTGVDLASSKRKKGNGQTVFFTACVYKNGDMQPLEIWSGNPKAPEIRDRIVGVHKRYGSIVFVEDNGTQSFIRDMLGEVDYVPVFDHHTGTNKHRPDTTIEHVFLMMSQGKWIIPSVDGWGSEEVEQWLDECRNYTRVAHSGDRLMASWFAWSGVRVVREYFSYFFGEDKHEQGGVRIFDGADAAE